MVEIRFRDIATRFASLPGAVRPAISIVPRHKFFLTPLVALFEASRIE
jgi:hypothetical protein